MKTILLIDDNEADQFLGEVVIHSVLPDVQIIQAMDGVEALEKLKSSNAEPDVILLDINMPRMNGHEFLENYYGGTGREVPVVVMLTSSDQQKDKDKAAEYPCVKDYLLKPISKESVEAIRKLLGI